jgi:phosphoribosylglycinamide formyltransferase-1
VARLAVLASGNGGNFQALVEALAARGQAGGGSHACALLVYDRKAAYAAERAKALGIASRYVAYKGREREEAEAEIAEALDEAGAELLALAGFMRLLSPSFVNAREGRIVNVHPSLLPLWPGKDSIARAFEAGAHEFGVTVHIVDRAMDSGPILLQESFEPIPGSCLAEIERRTHEIEHRIYPRAVLGLLDGIDARRPSL